MGLKSGGGIKGVIGGTPGVGAKVPDIKVLPPEPALDSRFFDEANIVNDCHHPNIVDVFDFVETEAPRRIAYVMELIDGPTLAKVVEAGVITPGHAVEIPLQVLDALRVAHELGSPIAT